MRTKSLPLNMHTAGLYISTGNTGHSYKSQMKLFKKTASRAALLKRGLSLTWQDANNLEHAVTTVLKAVLIGPVEKFV